MSAPSATADDRRAVAEHPWLQRTLRSALGLVSRELPDFDASLRRQLIARYRAREGIAAATPGSRAKALMLAHEAAFRSSLPRIVAVCLNAEFQRLRAGSAATPPPEADGTPRAAAIASLARQLPSAGPDGVGELDRRIARQLGVATLRADANPLRPAVFLHAVGVCWRTVSGSDEDELDVLGAYGTLWLPGLRRLLPALIAGLPEATPRIGPAARPSAVPSARGPGSGERGAGLPAPVWEPGAATADRPPAYSPLKRAVHALRSAYTARRARRTESAPASV
jgi:hypothetical protein